MLVSDQARRLGWGRGKTAATLELRGGGLRKSLAFHLLYKK